MNTKKNILSLAAAFLITVSGFSQATLTNSIDSLSYAIGVNIGQNLSQQGVQPNTDLIAKAISDVLGNKGMSIEPEECNAYIQSYFQNQMMNKAETNRKVSEEFLAANKSKAGVVTLPSGLQYKVLTAGTGAKPVTESKVKVHYEGKTIDGTIFDSSIQRGTPAEFGVTQVIKGWTEALQLMPIGSVWELYIPVDLAYGTQAPPKIGPNQALIFEVRLLEIMP
jgi:FKBP-type peptidyl-prolyl cis-trans isomerase FklB